MHIDQSAFWPYIVSRDLLETQPQFGFLVESVLSGDQQALSQKGVYGS
jgi:hypothetical protein